MSRPGYRRRMMEPGGMQLSVVGTGAARALYERSKPRLIVLGSIAAIWLILNAVLGGKFLTRDGIETIVYHSIFPAFIAWGMSFIFTGGLIDLSIGANVLLAANIGATLAVTLNWGYPGLVLGALVTAIILEHLSVRCSISLGIPSWIAGLGMTLVFEAVLSIYARLLASNAGERLPQMHQYNLLGRMPLMAIIWIAGFIAAYLLFTRSRIGLDIRAVGGNPSVAEAMGINAKRTVLLASLVGSIFIGVAAALQISYTSSMTAKTGLGSLSTIFKSLATLLLAQSFERTFSMPVGIFIGSIVVMSIFNVLTLLAVPTGTGQEMFLGGIVILCGIISHLKYREVVK
jgi:ribose transport system permease protein